MDIKLKVNSEEKVFEIELDEVLLDTLRRFGYTEVKGDCHTGDCGACTVLMNNKPVASCMILSAKANGSEIITIKGIGTKDKLHPIQKAFIETGAIQCGYCSPGTILSVKALLDINPEPTDEEIKIALDGNLCRCTGYIQQFEAVKLAVKFLKEEEKNG